MKNYITTKFYLTTRIFLKLKVNTENFILLRFSPSMFACLLMSFCLHPVYANMLWRYHNMALLTFLGKEISEQGSTMSHPSGYYNLSGLFTVIFPEL